MKAGKLHLGRRHVDVRGEDRDEHEREAPAGQELNRARGDEQTDAAEQLEHAADDDAGHWKRNPRRHDRQEEIGMAQVDRPSQEEERGEKQADERAEDQVMKIAQRKGLW